MRFIQTKQLNQNTLEKENEINNDIYLREIFVNNFRFRPCFIFILISPLFHFPLKYLERQKKENRVK